MWINNSYFKVLKIGRNINKVNSAINLVSIFNFHSVPSNLAFVRAIYCMQGKISWVGQNNNNQVDYEQIIMALLKM